MRAVDSRSQASERTAPDNKRISRQQPLSLCTFGRRQVGKEETHFASEQKNPALKRWAIVRRRSRCRENRNIAFQAVRPTPKAFGVATVSTPPRRQRTPESFCPVHVSARYPRIFHLDEQPISTTDSSQFARSPMDRTSLPRMDNRKLATYRSTFCETSTVALG